MTVDAKKRRKKKPSSSNRLGVRRGDVAKLVPRKGRRTSRSTAKVLNILQELFAEQRKTPTPGPGPGPGA